MNILKILSIIILIIVLIMTIKNHIISYKGKVKYSIIYLIISYMYSTIPLIYIILK